jgi:2-oxoglutarate ferredoxin oxidoreductase subunit alpha
MVYGAACTGKRVMTTSSSPGLSLMMEGISYIAGTEVPVVLINVMRGGPGLGNIAPAQGDYNQMVHGGGHGDYKSIVLAPANVQEAIDMTVLAFELAEKYRTIAIVIADGSIGQMMEPAELPPMKPLKTDVPDWAVTGAKGRAPQSLTSIELDAPALEAVNIRLQKRWQVIQENEVRYKEYFLDDAEIVLVAFGTAGRVAMTAVRAARREGIKVGLFRPLTLAPFPENELHQLAKKTEKFLVVEMNSGQMLNDVRLAVNGQAPVSFYGRMGGVIPFPDEILDEIHTLAQKPLASMNGTAHKEWLSRLTEEGV